MERILIIGCPGSGKSTFARELHARTNLPLYYLDMLYWNADRTTVPKEEFRRRLGEVLEKDSWIIDGNYGSTMALRLAACDTVFFLDYPIEVCLNGILERQGKPRPDLPWVEPIGEPDEEFLSMIRSYPQEGRRQVLELRERYPEKTWMIFQSRAETDAYFLK